MDEGYEGPEYDQQGWEYSYDGYGQDYDQQGWAQAGWQQGWSAQEVQQPANAWQQSPFVQTEVKTKNVTEVAQKMKETKTYYRCVSPRPISRWRNPSAILVATVIFLRVWRGRGGVGGGGGWGRRASGRAGRACCAAPRSAVLLIARLLLSRSTLGSILLSVIDFVLHCMVAIWLTYNHWGEHQAYWSFIVLALIANLVGILVWILQNAQDTPATGGESEFTRKLRETPNEVVCILGLSIINTESACFLTGNPHDQRTFRVLDMLRTLFEDVPLVWIQFSFLVDRGTSGNELLMLSLFVTTLNVLLKFMRALILKAVGAPNAEPKLDFFQNTRHEDWIVRAARDSTRRAARPPGPDSRRIVLAAGASLHDALRALLHLARLLREHVGVNDVRAPLAGKAAHRARRAECVGRARVRSLQLHAHLTARLAGAHHPRTDGAKRFAQVRQLHSAAAARAAAVPAAGAPATATAALAPAAGARRALGGTGGGGRGRLG